MIYYFLMIPTTVLIYRIHAVWFFMIFFYCMGILVIFMLMMQGVSFLYYFFSYFFIYFNTRQIDYIYNYLLLFAILMEFHLLKFKEANYKILKYGDDIFLIIYLSMSLTTHLHFQLCDSSLQSEQLLLQGCFLALQGCDLLLDTAIFCFLEIKVSLPKYIEYIITSLPLCEPANLINFSSHQLFSQSIQILMYLFSFLKFVLLSYDY